jgi:hypothetical protein
MKTIVRILMTAAAVMMFANFASAQIDQYLCENETVRGYEADNGDVASNYVWAVTGGVPFVGGISNTKQVQLNWTGIAPGDYTLTVQEGLPGCLGALRTFVIRVSPFPTAAISYAGGFVCSGAPFDLSVDYTGTAANWTFSYTINGGAPIAVAAIPSATDPYTLTIAGGILLNSTFEVVAISDNACSTPIVMSSSVTVDIQTFGTTGIIAL